MYNIFEAKLWDDIQLESIICDNMEELDRFTIELLLLKIVMVC